MMPLDGRAVSDQTPRSPENDSRRPARAVPTEE
jgi:hypothetical protein